MLVLTPADRVSIEEINRHTYFDDSIYNAVMNGNYGREREKENMYNNIWITVFLITI